VISEQGCGVLNRSVIFYSRHMGPITAQHICPKQRQTEEVATSYNSYIVAMQRKVHNWKIIQMVSHTARAVPPILYIVHSTLARKCP